MVDWSALPVDVLGLILMKLDFVEEMVYFSAVCSSWHCAYSMFKNNWTKNMPWLMLPENTKDNPNSLRKLFCPTKQNKVVTNSSSPKLLGLDVGVPPVVVGLSCLTLT